MALTRNDHYLDNEGLRQVWEKIESLVQSAVATLTTMINGKRDLFSLTDSWIGRNAAGVTYGVACRFKLTSVSEARSIFMRINARGVIHNLRIAASSSSLSIVDLQISNAPSDNDVYGYLDTDTGIVTIYLYMVNYREGASVTEFSPANYYYYNSRLTNIEFPDKEYVSTLPTGYVTAIQGGWARYDGNGNDISTYYAALVHSHGDITNDGAIASSTSIDGSNDHLVFSDASDDSKLKKTSVANVSQSMTGLANSGSATSLDDGTEFITSYSGPDGFSTTNRVNIWYKRKITLLWNYINSKITAGTGLTKTDGTINHSNSVTAQTSDLGSYNSIPIIRYDAQGHITYGSDQNIFSNEQYSTIKCGYVRNNDSGVGWYKVGEITYWTSTYQRATVVISVMGTYSETYNDYGMLRIRLTNNTTAGVASTPICQWLFKTAGTSTRFKTDCIRMVKNETQSSSGVTLSIYMYLAGSSHSYNFLVLNESIYGSVVKSQLLKFSNSTTKEITEPAPTYFSTMAPLELGNQSNCLNITNDNWQSYMTASNESSSFYSCDILTIPEGITSIFFSTQQTASISCIRGKETYGRFPRNGVRITIAGNWKPQENGGYAGGNAEGRFSQYLYTYRAGVSGSYKDSRMDDAFEDFLYFNGVWYSKGY